MLTMTNNFSTIFYTNLNNKSESFILPTIQSISVPDNTTIPSRPTITGEYRTQYVATSAIRVTLVVWLEAGDYGGETLDVSETLDHLFYLKTNRLPFNLITSYSEEESRFFNNIVIENISQNRDSQHRKRLVCTINCVQTWLTKITWKLASAIEIFGHEIFTDSSKTIETLNKDFVVGNANEDFELSDNKITELFKKLGDFSGFSDMPVNRHIRDAISGKVALNENSAYFKLSDPINMADGSKVYNCACQFKSKYAISDGEDAYTVDLGKFVLNITKKDVSLEQNYLVNAVTGPSDYTVNHNLPMVSYPYDTADTYPNYTVSSSFDHIEKFDSLAKFLKDAKENGMFTTDVNAVKTGSVVVRNGYVWSYKISKHYTFDVSYNSFKKNLTPDGALKIDTFHIPKDVVKITVSNEKKQSDWDGLNNGVDLVAITLGSRVQLYLFSNTLFYRTRVANST